MNEILYNDFYKVVLNEIPLIDVRSQNEYEKGSFKTSVNLPIMNNKEHCLVGTKYKKEGNISATELGYKLVSGEIKEERIKNWQIYIEQNPNAMIYCFRGGSRSQISQKWIYENLKHSIARLEGGYKAFRNYLIEAINPNNIIMKPIILGGYTGTGKTILLNKLNNQIDLECLANHRGSGFGNHVTAQPTQINFENNLAYDLIQKQSKGYNHIIFEDESSHIGKCYIPKPLFEYISSGELVIIEQPMEKRIEITLDEYVVQAQKEYINNANCIQLGMNQWFEYIVASITKLKRRFGEEHVKIVIGYVQKAFEKQLDTGDIDNHRNWIYLCLKNYYDPMYQYQIEKTTKKIIFRGNENEVFEFLNGMK